MRQATGQYWILEAAPGVGVTVWPTDIDGVNLPNGETGNFRFDREENLMILYREKVAEA